MAAKLQEEFLIYYLPPFLIDMVTSILTVSILGCFIPKTLMLDGIKDLWSLPWPPKIITMSRLLAPVMSVQRQLPFVACMSCMYLSATGPCLPLDLLTKGFCGSLEPLRASAYDEKEHQKGKTQI